MPPRPGAATRPAQSASAIIKAPEHVVTKDEKFHKRKLMKYGIIGTASVAIAVLVFFLVRMLNSVEVPDLVGQEYEPRVQTWALSNQVAVQSQPAYSLEFAEGIVMAQNREPGSSMARRSVIIVTVSEGPNMDEEITLPDNLEEMTRGQITTWQRENHVNITFRDEASAEVETNYVIRVEVPAAVDIDNFLRRDSLIIYISTGPETVQIGNMTGNNREQVNTFIENNPLIDVEIEYVAHETIARGTVLRQSHAPGTRLSSGETFTLTLSGGDPVIVPNFVNISRTVARGMTGGEGEVAVDFQERYHPTVPLGRLISQSVEAGGEIFGDETVTVIYSLGRPWIENMAGQFENQIAEAFAEFAEKGAPNLSFSVVFVDSYLPRGTIVSQTLHGQFVAMDAHVTFRISLQNLTPPVDLPPAPGNPGSGNNEDDLPEE